MEPLSVKYLFRLVTRMTPRPSPTPLKLRLVGAKLRVALLVDAVVTGSVRYREGLWYARNRKFL